MSTPSMNPPVEEPAPKGLSEPERIIDTFVAPRKTFADILRNANWLFAFLILAATIIGFVYSVQSKIGFATIAENRMRRMPKVQQMIDRMPDDKRSEYYENLPKSTQRNAYLQPLIFLAISFVSAAIYMATFNFALGAKVAYKHSLAVGIYSGLPMAVKYLIAAITVFAGVDPDGFNFDSPVASNIGSFFDPATHPALVAFGSFIDVFAIWSVILSAIGFAVVANVKLRTSMFVMFAWYLLFMLIFGGLGAVFMS